MFNSLMADKGTQGRPRYQRGDRVRFSFCNRETDEMEYLYGEVWIVDSYGTFFND